MMLHLGGCQPDKTNKGQNSNINMTVLVDQLCLSLYNAMDYSLPGSSIHRILHARILD